MIPAQAVEAAMSAVARNYGTAGASANTVLWERIESDVRAALEAAAPHMLAGAKAAAWDEGYDEAEHEPTYHHDPKNPYRSEA